MSDNLLFDCEIESESSCKLYSWHNQRYTDQILQVLQSVLRKVYIAEAILFKQLESSSTTQETEQLQLGLMKLSEVEERINLRIFNCINATPPNEFEAD